MTIGELARAGEVPATTVRYYERAGLVLPKARSDAGYRLYGPDALERLRFIRAAQAVGFALADIGSLLELETAGNDPPAAEVARMLQRRLAETEARLRDLKRVEAHLRAALTRCRASKGECAVMNDLRNPRRTQP